MPAPPKQKGMVTLRSQREQSSIMKSDLISMVHGNT